MRPSGSRLRVFIYRLLPPLNLPISLSLCSLFPRRISARTNFSWHEPHHPLFCTGAVAKGTRGRGGRSSVLNHLNALQRTRTTSTPKGPFHPPSFHCRRCGYPRSGPPQTGNVLEGGNRGKRELNSFVGFEIEKDLVRTKVLAKG